MGDRKDPVKSEAADRDLALLGSCMTPALPKPVIKARSRKRERR